MLRCVTPMRDCCSAGQSSNHERLHEGALRHLWTIRACQPMSRLGGSSYDGGWMRSRSSQWRPDPGRMGVVDATRGLAVIGRGRVRASNRRSGDTLQVTCPSPGRPSDADLARHPKLAGFQPRVVKTF
jgi:hypothetical protein